MPHPVEMRVFDHAARNMRDGVNAEVLGKLQSSRRALLDLDLAAFPTMESGDAVGQKQLSEAQQVATDVLAWFGSQMKKNLLPYTKNLETVTKKATSWMSKCPSWFDETKFTSLMATEPDAIANHKKAIEEQLNRWVVVTEHVPNSTHGRAPENAAKAAKASCMKSIFEFAMLMLLRTPGLNTVDGGDFKSNLQDVIESISEDFLGSSPDTIARGSASGPPAWGIGKEIEGHSGCIGQEFEGHSRCISGRFSDGWI